ncbi:catalase [Klebsiella pneumoniae]|uniref:Catalase n=1 Tax=Klebsiella pneumoniae TaxID=573 RepID=A0A2X3DFG6_KLEPN|nr:catalase [Klebsiella pneumoniae]
MLPTLQAIQRASGKASLADIIVLAGVVGVEQAAAAAGVSVNVPFTPGRVDALPEQTDVESFDLLQPLADGFRNYRRIEGGVSTETLLIDKAQQLTLTAPENDRAGRWLARTGRELRRQQTRGVYRPRRRAQQ